MALETYWDQSVGCGFHNNLANTSTASEKYFVPLLFQEGCSCVYSTTNNLKLNSVNFPAVEKSMRFYLEALNIQIFGY
jgi:hypothetical protein